jgi:hypothetical protein
MLTLDQAVPISGLSNATLQRAIRAGKLSATRAEKDGYSYRIDPAELQRFMSTRVCLVCGAALTGAYQRNLCPEHRKAREKELKDAKLRDPKYHEQFYAKRRVLKAKPVAKAKARAAEQKRRGDPDVREKQNAQRRKHPVQHDAHVRDFYRANPTAKTHKLWVAMKGDPVELAEHNAGRRVRNAGIKRRREPGWMGSIDAAMDFLRRKLAKGPRPVKEIERLAKDEDISIKTLKRARKELGVKAKKSGLGGWMLSL